jgi:hybrid cluster-associated redox disulfide protein
MTVTRDTLIIDILRNCPDVNRLAELFQDIGMHCLGCHLSEDETVEEACLVHGADVDKFLGDINNLMAFKLTKNTIIADILKYAPEVEPVFYAYGMHCLGCEISLEETLEEACAAHGVDADDLIAKAEDVIADFAVA